MDQNGTGEEQKAPGTALVVLDPPRQRLRSLSRAAQSNPAFLSQLLAERGHLPAQRQLRRAEPGEARTAYAEGSRRGIRRLPLGFYSTRLV